jgi:ABC-2 type transport system ATP-binding protein
MSDSPTISIRNLTVRYGRSEAVSNVSLAVSPGTVYVLLGRNGAGKTSLIRSLLGLQPPTAGEASIFGLPVWKKREEVMSRTGVVPEEPDAPPEMNVHQIVDFCGRLYRRWNGALVHDRLERFSIPMNVAFARLSRGQKAQVSLALALGHEPELLVLDDPTLGLDVVARRAFFEEVIGDLADRGTTVFLTTHDLASAEGLATRVGILSEGKLVLDEELETVKERFRRIRVSSASRGALDSFGVARLRHFGTSVEADVTNYEESLLQRLDGRAEVVPMSLEEIFVAVTGEEESR